MTLEDDKNIMKLGILFFGSVHERTGAGKVVKTFGDSINLFKDNGIEASLYSNERVKDNSKFLSKSFISSMKSTLASIMKRGSIGSYMLIDKLYFKKGEYVVNKSWNDIINNDVLIFHDIFTCYAYVNRCIREGVVIKPYIFVLHSNGEVYKMLKIYYPKLNNSNSYKKLENRAHICLKEASQIVFVAKTAAQHFKSLYPDFSSKTTYVYNGIEGISDSNGPVFDGKIRMITVGTVNARKNQILQVKSLKTILKSTDATLTIVGDGDKLSECKELALELGVSDNVIFTGARDNIPEILKKCNLFVMSSLDEGLPISIIEALRAKLPIIVTDVGGNKELVENNGWLINPTEDDIIKSVLSFKESINRQKEMSDASYRLFIKTFTTEKMIDNYCMIIQEVCDKGL